ncbi:hypothetical protein C8J57DRAFT_1383194 [Mycena rebaudengoi]|nr:hypothetical protein C8J57DRAFT_1383194 [Mycena rebaudengoi]
MFQAPPAAPPQAQPAAPPQAPPALPQQPVAPQLPAAPPAFTIPSIDELSAQVPTHRAENPNTRKQTAKGVPPLTNDGKVAFQRCMAGRWDEVVITMATINRGVATKQIIEVRTNAHRYLAFVVADGGRFVFENLPFIKAEILAGLSGLVNGDEVTLHPPVAHAVQEDSTKYGGGRAIFAEFTSLAARARVLQFAPTFAIKSENTLAFHAVTIDYSRESWAVAGFYTNSTLPPAIQTSALRAAIIHDSLENPTIVQEADQMIQGIVPGVTPQERAYEAFKSIDVQFVTHDEKPLLVVFRKPCAGDPDGNKRLNKMIGSAIYGVGNMEFRPFNANGNPLHCVICVSDCHSAYICTFVRGPDPWWGPPDQLSAITTGPLAPKASNANTSRGNGHRNDGTPMRGGAGGGRGGRRGGRDGRGRRGNH